MPTRLRALLCSMAITCAAAAQDKVAVLPIDPRPGALNANDASALTAELRSAARDAVGATFEIVDADGGDVAAALESTGATAAVFGRVGQMEGATVIGIGVYRHGSGTPAALARVVGIGLPQLKSDLHAKVPKLLAGALGLAPPASQPPQRAGTLRMPGGTPAPLAAAVPQTQTQAPAPEPRIKRAPPPPNEDPLVKLIRETTEDVEELRGLRRRQNLRVQILDDKLFTAAVREKAKREMTPAVVAAERARWMAFNLAPVAADPAQVLLDVLDEQVAGFYDQFTKQLIVRREPPASAGDSMGPDGLRIILAHEIEHALQDQNFGIPDMAALPDDDVRLARSALFEGDAMAVMTAYAAHRAQKPVKAAVLSGAATLSAVDTETLLRMSGKSPALLHAPPVLREELVVPYSAGFALVAEAYRRGGFALVDKMFKSPPSSVHQVVHPDAYFAGEQPAAVQPPAAPPGTRVISRGRMGELGTRVALETCVDKAVVKELAPKWAGDAYTIVEGAKGSISLLWTTAWSGGVGANVTNVMKLVPPCWEDQAANGPGPNGWSIAAPSKIGGAGDVVAVARGSIDLDAAVARQLGTRVAAPKAAPPVGDVQAPAPVEPARVDGNRFVSPRLALQGEVPEGYQQDSSNPVAELAIKKTGPAGGGAALSFVPEALTGDSLDAFFQTASAQIAAAQGGHLTFIGKSERNLAGAAAEERAWAMDASGMELRIDVAPYCSGKAALTLLRLEGSDAARGALDKFAASMHASGNAPACSELE